MKVAANENYAAWEALLAANPDAKALVGLCAPDIASLGKLQAANTDKPFVSGGYDLTAENLAEIKAGNAYVSLGQTPFMQGYLPVKILADTIREQATVDLSKGGFLDAGTEIVTADSVDGAVRPAAADVRRARGAWPPIRPKARAYYQPLVDGQIADWATKRRAHRQRVEVAAAPLARRDTAHVTADRATPPADRGSTGPAGTPPDGRVRTTRRPPSRSPGCASTTAASSPSTAWTSPSRPGPSTPSSARTAPANRR